MLVPWFRYPDGTRTTMPMRSGIVGPAHSLPGGGLAGARGNYQLSRGSTFVRLSLEFAVDCTPAF